MKLIVGLGNPGRKYVETRHNIGWMVLAELARRSPDGSRPQSNFHGEVVEASLGSRRLLLLAPHTYMNRSGRSVRAAVDFYKLNTEDVLVVCDDIHLPLGKLRLRAKGSAGGQKGLEDVIRHLGADQVARLRIGIDSPPEGWDAAAYVLAKFTPQDKAIVEPAITLAAEAAECWAKEGIQTAMNRYN